MLEPHHDLSFDTLTYLVSKGFFEDERSFDRLVYIDWGNGAFVPFNVLKRDGKRSDETIALQALDAMTRVWPELSQAPLFQQLFLSATVTLTACELPITFLYRLLANAEFRRECLKKVDDPLVHEVFDSFDKLGRDQVQAAGSTLRRAFLLSFSPFARLTLGQPDNWLDFRKLMDEGKAVIINLGNINDEQTKRLLGAMIMVGIEQAALSRSDLLPADRKPFTLIVDEWPSFAASEETISTILSQTRKFGLRIWLAAQSLAGISSVRLLGALENCRLLVFFGLGRASAELSSKHIANVDPFVLKEEALTPTQHAQYLSVSEQFEQWTGQLQNLSPRHAFVKLDDEPAVRIQTLTVDDKKVDPKELERVLSTYRERYQRSKEEAVGAIRRISAPAAAETTTTPPAPAYTKLFGRGEDEEELVN